jgi:hypothetical protein
MKESVSYYFVEYVICFRSLYFFEEQSIKIVWMHEPKFYLYLEIY